ncbi:MAG TPA: MsnO8 family LLM class oxidoreductase [Candidatus Saccharimonadales bacterium]|nr:MsnO8 family LLM class oxidoreductase [Candidatus Saccharimonadales bacterium]
MKFAAIDATLIRPGQRASDAVRETSELAPFLESLNFSRFWLTEHHSENHGQSSPEVLLCELARKTIQMTIGTAGILLDRHDPLRIAESFLLLHSLFPGRVDLGLARGKEGQNSKASSLSELKKIQEDGLYENSLQQLLSCLDRSSPMTVHPADVASPSIWLDGSSRRSALLAAKHGLSFCVADFLLPTPEATLEVLEIYARSFVPSYFRQSPYACVAMAGVCGHPRNTICMSGMAKSIYGEEPMWRRYLSRIREHPSVQEFAFWDIHSEREGKRDSFAAFSGLMKSI